MSQKNILAIIVAILTALGSPAVIDKLNTPVVVEVELLAPDTCVVGELVQLNYEARKVEWNLPTKDNHIDGTQAWISFRTPGEYEIVVTGLAGEEVKLARHTIAVIGGSVQKPKLKPILSNIDTKVRQWCQEANCPAETCRLLAGNFSDAASTTSTLNDLLKKTSQLNREASQDGCQEVLVKLQVWMIGNLTGKSYEEHKVIWEQIAEGFTSYADEKE